MSNWLVFLIGIIGGIFFGMISARKNYESCQDQLQKLEADIQARKEKLSQTEVEIDEAAHHLDEISQEVAIAKGAAIDATASEEETIISATEDVAAEPAELTPATEEAVPAAEADAMEAAQETGEQAAAEAPAMPEQEGEALPVAEAAATEIAQETGEQVAAVTPAAAAGMRAAGIELEDVQVTECPQKLSRIKGIGRVYETKLYRAGIGTYWQVATLPLEKMAEVLNLKDFQAVNLEAIQEGARQLAEETNTVGKVWNGHEPEDLENLPGIGKTYEGRLYDAGVCTWKKLASLTPEELAAIVRAPKWNQPDYAAWIAYAKAQLTENA